MAIAALLTVGVHCDHSDEHTKEQEAAAEKKAEEDRLAKVAEEVR